MKKFGKFITIVLIALAVQIAVPHPSFSANTVSVTENQETVDAGVLSWLTQPFKSFIGWIADLPNKVAKAISIDKKPDNGETKFASKKEADIAAPKDWETAPAVTVQPATVVDQAPVPSPAQETVPSVPEPVKVEVVTTKVASPVEEAPVNNEVATRSAIPSVTVRTSSAIDLSTPRVEQQVPVVVREAAESRVEPKVDKVEASTTNVETNNNVAENNTPEPSAQVAANDIHDGTVSAPPAASGVLLNTQYASAITSYRAGGAASVVPPAVLPPAVVAAGTYRAPALKIPPAIFLQHIPTGTSDSSAASGGGSQGSDTAAVGTARVFVPRLIGASASINSGLLVNASGCKDSVTDIDGVVQNIAPSADENYLIIVTGQSKKFAMSVCSGDIVECGTPLANRPLVAACSTSVALARQPQDPCAFGTIVGSDVAYVCNEKTVYLTKNQKVNTDVVASDASGQPLPETCVIEKITPADGQAPSVSISCAAAQKTQF